MQTKRWYQDWLGWVIVVSICYGIICLISLASDVGRPFPGFFTYFNAIGYRMEIEWNVPSWWWSATEEHPRLSDILVQVNNTPFKNIPQPVKESALYRELWAAGQRTIYLTVEREGQLVTIPVNLERFSWRYYIDLMFMPVIVAACYWLLTIILYRADGQNKRQRLVIVLLCAIATLSIALKGSLFIFGSWREALILFINPTHSFTATVIGAVLIQLAFQFPTRRWPRLQRPVLFLVYSLCLVLYGFFLVGKITTWHIGVTPLAHWLDYIWHGVFQLIIMGGIAFILLRMLGEALFLPDKTREREEARIILLAFFLFLPTVWFAIHGAFGTNASILFLQSLADARLMGLVVPFAFAAISLRYQTFSGAQNWLFFASILAVSGFLANMGVALLFWNSPQIIHDLPFPPTAVLFLLLLFAGLFWGWQSSWRGWLGRLFHWERIHYRAVQQFSHTLAARPYQDISQAAQQITTTLHQELSLEWAACWLTEESKFKLAAVNGRSPDLIPKILSPPASLTDQTLRLSPVKPAWLQSLNLPTTAALPLFISGECLGLIAVGQHWDIPIFDDRDLEILALIGQQAALVLHNTQQTAQLRQTDQQLLHIQKLTRQKTAQNLHDHILPALSQLQMKLLTANQLIDRQPQNAHKLLNESQESLRENAKLVRRIQKDLVIRPLEYGLAPYLQELITQFHQETDIPINVSLPTTLDTTITDISIRETIYAVWQQALDNIQQHAQATAVKATLSLDDTQLTFSICDNGRGSLPEQQKEALQNGHFGLRSMQIRLQSIGGQFFFQSNPGQGSCVKGQIPLNSIQ